MGLGPYICVVVAGDHMLFDFPGQAGGFLCRALLSDAMAIDDLEGKVGVVLTARQSQKQSLYSNIQYDNDYLHLKIPREGVPVMARGK